MPDLLTRLMTPARAALVGGRRILGFDANLFDAILRNVHRRDDGGGIIFRNSDRGAIEHVVDGSDKRAVDRVSGDVDSRAPDRNILNRLHRIARVGRAVDRNHARTQLDEIVNVAVQQRDPVDGLLTR